MTIDFSQLPKSSAVSLPGAALPPAPGSLGTAVTTIDSVQRRDIRGLPLHAVLRAMNHLLKQQSWARERLLPHVGRSVRIGIDASFPLAALTPNLMTRIGEDGLLQQVSASSADVSLWLKPSVQALFSGVRDGPQGLAAHLRVDGDVMLAGVLGALAQNLRWDVAEDLSHVVGDVAAQRVVNAVQALRNRANDSRDRLSSSAVQFLTVEQPHLVDGISFRQFRDELAQLERHIAQLARRAI